MTMVPEAVFSSESSEWYTPGHIIELARTVLGEIDLDPASCEVANRTVQATRYYAREDNGLLQPWYGKVWMNPPYGKQIKAWVDRLLNQYETGAVSAALALLPARTDSAWFQPVHNYARCWLRGRLRFMGAESSAPFPSVVVYLGPNFKSFAAAFGQLGFVDNGANKPPSIQQAYLW